MSVGVCARVCFGLYLGAYVPMQVQFDLPSCWYLYTLHQMPKLQSHLSSSAAFVLLYQFCFLMPLQPFQ